MCSQSMDDIENTLLLYTLSEQETQGTLSLQAYPSGYDSMMIFVSGLLIDETVKMYHLTHSSPTLEGLDIIENYTITVQVQDNGYVYAAGIWQVYWSHEQERHVLQCVCSIGLDLMEVTHFLLAEERELVQQAISAARMFLRGRCFSPILLVCREKGEYAPEVSHQHAPLPQNIQTQEHTWYMLWNCWTPAEPPTRCRVSVSYHPERSDEPFQVELLAEWMSEQGS